MSTTPAAGNLSSTSLMETPSNEAAEGPDADLQASADVLRADRISYIADMIGELQGLAHEAKCTTLAVILGLAHAEALQQAQNVRDPI